MSEELKPVRCECGGKSQVFFPFTNNSVYMIECKKCGICTSAYETEAEAIQAWNTAMGAKDIDVPTKERTAKVIDEVGLSCGNCDQWLKLGWSWCPKCGAKLEWK